jgi:hypothetical protein
VREHIEAARQRLVDERAEVKILSSQVRASRDLLDSAFVKIQEQYS